MGIATRQTDNNQPKTSEIYYYMQYENWDKEICTAFLPESFVLDNGGITGFRMGIVLSYEKRSVDSVFLQYFNTYQDIIANNLSDTQIETEDKAMYARYRSYELLP